MKTEYWVLWELTFESTHKTLRAAVASADKCEKEGGGPHTIIRATKMPRHAKRNTKRGTDGE
jgi:hypothetical protein